ncbi:hypothetical protein [Microbulbifer thermotolerans]|uniref:hypothetical protein n=1 Tax=Microbulbifer thermotolerans TaxID=252514 RepID=UPI00224BA119|nr:hypothetical protein [Microbulbifer thermotolerans]MCX2781112.1 hypothetical protein [Microbulbifer thermotolerans]MCX2806703.1 hypothetical protein [Microbulbifer thermotolerans]MCX2843216.1 hypothetical protein [Microbulbifer thermotolerans]
MSNKMEDILGLGSIDTERKIPGTTVTEGREYRYVSCSNNADIAALFKKVIREINPPLATSGGAVNEGCKVTLPSGECYFAISYKGDIEGWRQQVEQGAAALGLLVAKISQDKLVLSDGNEVLLSECKFQFD